MGLWKDISRETKQLKHDCCFVLGDGSKVRFWEDSWCGDGPLCETFPLLFALADSKGAMVADLWNTYRGDGVWNSKFMRSFNDWEMELIQNFVQLINNSSVNP